MLTRLLPSSGWRWLIPSGTGRVTASQQQRQRVLSGKWPHGPRDESVGQTGDQRGLGLEGSVRGTLISKLLEKKC